MLLRQVLNCLKGTILFKSKAFAIMPGTAHYLSGTLKWWVLRHNNPQECVVVLWLLAACARRSMRLSLLYIN